jgi:hypothetical protein
MTRWITLLCVLVGLSIASADAQISELRFPERVVAGTALSIPTTGSGTATCYIVGPGNAIRREFHLGETLSLTSNDLHNTGRYVVLLVATKTQSAQFDGAFSPALNDELSETIASTANLPDGISGVAYVRRISQSGASAAANLV